jgi:hypothetical protein
MIPVEQKRDVLSSGAEGTASFEISTKDAAHIMTILRDTLYSDKVLAVLREYSANAWDANRMVDRGDVPIEVTLPTYSDPTLKIRDRGPGLSKTDVFEVYNKYGASTKRDSNVAVGMLGIGSKSGFAYSDSFTITSWHGGYRATYIAVIDSSEKGKVDLFHMHRLGYNDETGEPDASLNEDVEETGVEIQMAVRPADINEFTTKAQSLFAFFKPQPKINTTLPPIPKGQDFEGLGTILTSDDNSANSYSYGYGSRGSKGWTAVMGCVPYKINTNQLKGLSSSYGNVSGILYFDIGTLQVAASREELKYGDSTKEALTDKINTIIDKYVEHLLDGVDKLNQWDRRIRVRHIKDLYLPVPSSLKGLDDSYVTFDNQHFFKLKAKGYKGKIDGCNGVKIAQKTRLVIRNERRVLQGYALQEGDIVVDPVLDEAAMRKHLREQITKHRIEGVPMVNISTIPWARPASNARPGDPARSRAACVVLDPANIHADRKSERWTVASRVAQATDVYVVIEAYAVNNLSDFYETYENDRNLIESIGGKMPPVIGYRVTKTTPVDRSKLKGKDYKDWRDTDFVQLLLQQPNVAAAVAAKVWATVSSHSLNDAHIKAVGETHPVGVYLRKVLNGRLAFGKFDKKIENAVSRVFYAKKENEAKVEWKKLVQMYPLFEIIGENDTSQFSGYAAKRWIEYIVMVDLFKEMNSNFSDEDDKKEQAA